METALSNLQRKGNLVTRNRPSGQVKRHEMVQISHARRHEEHFSNKQHYDQIAEGHPRVAADAAFS